LDFGVYQPQSETTKPPKHWKRKMLKFLFEGLNEEQLMSFQRILKIQGFKLNG
jgi:hypothetical protein